MIPHFKPEVDQAGIDSVVAALRAGRLGQGEEVTRLEQAISARFGGASVVAVSSGTAALYLALAALDLRRGQKIVIPSYTCNSLYAAAAFAGCEAVCADVPDRGLSLTRETVAAVFTDSVGAVIVPHTAGYLADVDGILSLGRPVIEDCCHAFGGAYPDGTPAGAKGSVAIVSFYATKLLPSGEGGACITRSDRLADAIRALRNCDERPPDPRAFNFKMSDVCAAIARSQLGTLDAHIEERRRMAAEYDDAFGPRAFRSSSSQPEAVCFRYLVRARDASAFIARAEAVGVTVRRPVYRPLHVALGGECPRTEHLYQTLVSVPLYPGLPPDARREICRRLPDLLSPGA